MLNQFHQFSLRGVAFFIVVFGLTAVLHADPLHIVKVEPTVLFPKVKSGEPLRQLVRISIENSGAETEAKVKITLPELPAVEESLGLIGPGTVARDILVSDINKPAELTLEIYGKDASKPDDVKKMPWQPQRKWKIYCVSYSHHDLGFGNYPHRLRTDIRHANIERPLEFCRETDSWDEDSRFRYQIETSEPITSFLSTHSEADAAELARRIREGRIQIGAIHTTVNTEQLGHELMARLFYLTNRHTCDLLNVPPTKTSQIDDVVGLTWPLATMCKEADVPYFFHGHNFCAECFRPASDDVVFNWQGPGGNTANKVLVHTRPYGTNWDSINATDEPAITKIIAMATKIGWPYDSLISQDGTDFQLITLDNATKIHNWNAKWAYPRLICATMDMFFDAIAAEADPAKIKAFAKDGNNQWADQDSAAAQVLAEARKQGEAIPTAEKFATIAAALGGGEYPWTDIYQAYHRLLLYHEHTDGLDNAYEPSRDTAQRGETEQAEMREMVDDAKYFCNRAYEKATNRLASQITTTADRTVVVFNPLNHSRTDVVRISAANFGKDASLIDSATQQAVPFQRDGEEVCFLAADVPSLGYKTYRVAGQSNSGNQNSLIADEGKLENRFYQVQFDATTGAITSVFDKELNVELVDQTAPHKFNEYLYERFETPEVKDGSKWYRVQSAKLHNSAGPVFARMTVESSAVGAEKIVQNVILYDGVKRIDFTLDLVKSPSGRDHRVDWTRVLNKESVFAALPFQIPDFQFHHEVPGAVEEPVKDLFQGACTAYYAVRHFSDVSNSHYGVTVSAPESSLVEYGRPRSCPNPLTCGFPYEMDMTPPANSRMYLYLMNNMFDCNIPLGQPGPARFTWSIKSHPGDWQKGQADRFGWETQNPLFAKIVTGKQEGTLPEKGSSFLSVDSPNVVCSTIKPAEANGQGVVLRFVETQGKATTAVFHAQFFGRPRQAIETNLLEQDRKPLAVAADGKVTIQLEPFGVKTVRLLSSTAMPAVPHDVAAKPLSDKEISLNWKAAWMLSGTKGYFRVYRGTSADFKPGLLNLVASTAETSVVDRPELRFGGWINNRMEPETTYYYRIAAVDRWNNEGMVSAAVKATTRKSSEKNAPPHRVERLSALLISPPTQQQYANLLFRTNCESDVVRYEIHRSATPGFTPGDKTLVGDVDANAVVPGSSVYGHTPIDRRVKDFDHIMYQDETVAANSAYYYCVRAVNESGSKGPFSEEARIDTKDESPLIALGRHVSSQSLFAPEYGKVLAIDGDADPFRAWISKPYGGGTKDHPRDVWWAIEFPGKKPLKIKGVKIFGDHREVIPLQKNLQVQLFVQGEWKTVAEIHDAGEKDILATWSEEQEASGIRIFVPAVDLPHSENAAVDGIVRICELRLVLADGREAAVADALKAND